MSGSHWIAPLTFLLAACAATPPPAEPTPAAVVLAEPEPAPAPPAQRPDGERWKSTQNVDHPDVGRVWSNSGQTALTWEQFLEKLNSSQTILLGETHDNPDHHDMQAAILVALSATGRRPVVVFEMIDPYRDKDLKKFASKPGADPDELRKLLAWDASGWPEWSIYRPVFVAAVTNELPIRGAQIPHDKAKQVAGRGVKAVAAVAPKLVKEHGLAHPLEPELRAGLEDELFESHCKIMPRHHLGGMLFIQRVRDALMASRLEKANKKSKEGAVLIAGAGHVRNDWAVPRYLKRRGHHSTSVAFVEVDVGVDSETGGDTPMLTAVELSALPYDYVVLTPSPARGDMCAELKERL